jgi:DNA-binding NtrC family response regulator
MNPREDTFRARPMAAGQVLVMEDESSVAQGLKMVLQEEGYDVDLASTGRSALDKMKQGGFDLLVADLRLPDMDGMEVIREVKGKRPEIKVIIITGYGSVSSAVDAMKLGVSDYLAKPFWDDDFKAAVEKALRGRKDVHLKEHPDIVDTGEGPSLMESIRETPQAEPKRQPQVLLMEDESNLAQGLRMVLTEEGYGVDLAPTGHSAMDSLRKRSFDLLVADLRLPDIDGMDVIREVRDKRPETEVIVITGYGSVASAVESMKLGAFDYLSKPFTEDEFRTAVEGALREKKEAVWEKRIEPPVTEEERLIQKREVIRVLDRTARDFGFWRELLAIGSKALDGYQLSNEAKAAIVSGDLKWINQHVGELTQKQLMFIYKRLEREAW